MPVFNDLLRAWCGTAAAVCLRMRNSFDANPLLAEYGDALLVCELTQMFVQTASSMMSAVVSAVRQRDGIALKAAAHRLRGSLAIFGASQATELALALECRGAACQFDGADLLAAQLADHVASLAGGASAWLASQAA